MIKQGIFGTVKDLFVELYQDCLDIVFEGRHYRYIKVAVFGLVIIAGLGGGYFGYMWYTNYCNRAAQRDLGALLDAYVQAQEKKDTVQFISIAKQANNAYQKHTRVAGAPFFVSLQVSALMEGGRKEEARAVLSSFIPKLSDKNEAAPLLKAYYALLMLDGTDEDQRQGVLELKALAYDVTNLFRDYALYHLGMYYWVNDKIKEAKEAWQELVVSQRGALDALSPWVHIVEDKLDSVAA